MKHTLILLASALLFSTSNAAPNYKVVFYNDDTTLPVNSCAAETALLESILYPVYESLPDLECSSTSPCSRNLRAQRKLWTCADICCTPVVIQLGCSSYCSNVSCRRKLSEAERNDSSIEDSQGELEDGPGRDLVLSPIAVEPIAPVAIYDATWDRYSVADNELLDLANDFYAEASKLQESPCRQILLNSKYKFIE